MGVKRFCLECGKEAESSDLICTECGTPLAGQKRGQVQSEKTLKNEKSPMTKKKKAMTVIGVLFFAILVGSYMYGNTYTSAENSLKRFHEAVFDKDKGALKKLVEFEDGKKLSDGELDAIITYGEKEPNEFTKSIGQWDFGSGESFLFAFKQSGKVFGIFDGYKIIVPNQTVSVPFPYEEMEYTLNGEKMKVTMEDDRAIIGPVAPGIYELNAEYKGEYAESSQSKQIELLESDGEVVFESLDFDISEVTFELESLNGIDPSKVELLIGDKKVGFDKDGYIKSAGPFVLDGSVKVKTVSEFPWGTIESEELEVEQDHMYMKVNGIDKEAEKSLVAAVLAYGEQYVVARAEANTKGMKTATDEWKKVIGKSFDNEREYGGYFSGQLDEVQVDIESAYAKNEDKQFEIVVPVSFSLQTSVDTEGENPELTSEIQSCTMEVSYVMEEWKVASCQGGWFTEEAGGTVVEGSKKLQKAVGAKGTKKEDEDSSKETTASKDEPASKETGIDRGDLEGFMKRYNDASVAAINSNDYSKVSGMIVSGAPRDKEQSDFIVHLNKSKITEDHLGTSLESFKSIDDTTVEVTTIESFNLHYPDKDSAEKSYTTVSQLKLVDGEWKMHKLMSTTVR